MQDRNFEPCQDTRRTPLEVLVLDFAASVCIIFGTMHSSSQMFGAQNIITDK
jgi:hypothetical protein